MVCPDCLAQHHCPICGVRHGPAMCPEVRAVWDEQEAQANVALRQEIAAWADMLRAEYEAWPIWKDAA
jgi:hypothetical protein